MAKNERYIKDLVLGLPTETVEPIIRKFLKDNQFSQQLFQLLPADSPYRDQAQTENKTEENLLCKSKFIAYTALICMLCFFVIDLIINPPNHTITYLATLIAIVSIIIVFKTLRK